MDRWTSGAATTQTVIDRDGYDTFVVGTEDQRQAIARIPGATFLPLSSANRHQPYKINLRNMLPSPRFGEAVQSVPLNGNQRRQQPSWVCTIHDSGFAHLPR